MANGTPDVTPTATPTPDQTQLTAPAAPTPDVTNAPVQTTLTAPAASAPPNATLRPNTSNGWNNFKSGWASQTPSYTADENGKIVRNSAVIPHTKGGILGAILSGALKAAAAATSAQAPRGSMGRGAAASAGAQAVYERHIAEEDHAQQVAQLNFANQQAVKKNKMEQSLNALQQAQLTQQMAHEKTEFTEQLKKWGIEDQGAQLNLDNQRDQRAQTQANLVSALNSANIQPIEQIADPSGAAHKVHGQLVKHVPGVMSGGTTILQNGQQGKDNGMHVYATADLDKPIPVGQQLILQTYDGSMNADGTFHQTPIVVQGDGKATYGDYARQVTAQQNRQNMLSAKYAQSVAVKKDQAEINEDNAKAFEDRAQGVAANMGFGEGGPANLNWNLTGQDFENQLPGQLKAIVDPVLKYQVNMNALGRGQQKAKYLSFVAQSDPNKGTPGQWSEQNYNERNKFITDYGDAKGAAGAQRIRLNTAIGHFDQLGTAAQALAQNDVQALNKIANMYDVQTGATPAITYQLIANKAAGEMAGAVKGGSGSATDQEIDKALQAYNPKLSPAQQVAVVKNSLQLLNTVRDSLGAAFQSTMGVTADQYGQPVISPASQALLNKWGVGAGVGGNVNLTAVTPAANPEARPQNVPANYVWANGPHGLGWYKPATK